MTTIFWLVCICIYSILTCIMNNCIYAFCDAIVASWICILICRTNTNSNTICNTLFVLQRLIFGHHIYMSLLSNTKSKLIAICDIILYYLLQKYVIMNTYKTYYLYISLVTHTLLICVRCVMHYFLLYTTFNYQIRRYNGESA